MSSNQARDCAKSAETLVRCQQLAEADSRLSMSERQAKVRDYADRAAALIKDGAEAAGDDPEALSRLAWFLATCPDSQLRDPAQAVKLAKNAAETVPRAGNVWSTLGVATYRVGEWDEAIEALSRSMELTSGGMPADWFFLAMAYWQKGDKDKAGSWYEKAVQEMEKSKSKDEDLGRFRAEAAALLGVTEHLKPADKKEENNPQRSRL